MKLTKTKFERPLTGIGPVKLGEKSFTILLTYKDEKGNEQEDKFPFKFSDLPENLPDEWELKNGKSYFASISADGSKLLGIRPAKGLFQVRCTALSETKDGEYLVVERKGEYGPYSQFVPLLTVQKGDNKGIDYPIYLPYSSGETQRFAPGDEGLMEVRGNPEKSRPIAQLFEFVTYTGIADLDLEYPKDDDDEYVDDPQEVLDVIYKAIRKQKQDFMILVENGYVKSMSELDDDSGETDTVSDDEKEETKEEETPKKKSKPKWDED